MDEVLIGVYIYVYTLYVCVFVFALCVDVLAVSLNIYIYLYLFMQTHIMYLVYIWSLVFVRIAIYDGYQINANCDLSYVVIQRKAGIHPPEVEIKLSESK